MILYGASGHGKVVKSAVLAEVVHFFDDNELIQLFQGLSVSLYNAVFLQEQPVVITVGNNKIRKRLSSKVQHKFGQVIAASSIVDKSVFIGHGSQILHNATIQADVIIANHVIINTSSSVDHDCVIADFVHIAPNATLCGNIKVGEGSLVGAGAVVIPGITIGAWCKIGAGAVVTKNIPDYSTAVGNPARIIKRQNV